MLILSRELSDVVSDIRYVLKRAEEINQEEIAMIGIRRMLISHLMKNSSKYTIDKRVHDPPWEVFFVQFHDRQGNVFNVYADQYGFQLDVWPVRDDNEYRKELYRRMTEEIDALYTEQKIEIDTQCNAKAKFINAATKRFKKQKQQRKGTE